MLKLYKQPPGDTGPTGETGPTGYTGPTGASGIGNLPYAVISDNNTQTPAVAATPTLITLSTNVVLNSITHTATSGIITFQTAGTYQIVVSAIVSQTVAQTTSLDIWLRKNGADLSNSNRRRSLTSATDVGSMSFSYLVAMAASDTLEIYQSVTVAGRGTGIYAFAPASEPVAPSVLVTIVYIST